MFAKLIILGFLIIIIYCLGSALFYMLSRKKTEEATAKALTWRVALSLTLFLLLLLGFWMGWIHPHGVAR